MHFYTFIKSSIIFLQTVLISLCVYNVGVFRLQITVLFDTQGVLFADKSPSRWVNMKPYC